MVAQGQPQSQEVVEPGFHIQSKVFPQALPLYGPSWDICAAEMQQYYLWQGHPGRMGQLQHQGGRSRSLCWMSWCCPSLSRRSPPCGLDVGPGRQAGNLSFSFSERKERVSKHVNFDWNLILEKCSKCPSHPADPVGTSCSRGAWSQSPHPTGPVPDLSACLPSCSLVVSTAPSRLTSYCSWKPFCDLRNFEKRTNS